MKSPKIPLIEYLKYFREVSVVVIGVAVTLAASHYITKKNEKRDIHLYLNAIKIELEENVNVLDSAILYFTSEAAYSNYLIQNDVDSLDADSIIQYSSTFFIDRKFSLKMNAFEMFKTSGIMRLLEDKELMQSLWKIYGDISVQAEVLEWYFHLKWADLQKEISVLDKKSMKDEKLMKPTILAARPLYNFYTIGITYSMLNNCNETLKETQEAIEKLEKTI